MSTTQLDDPPGELEPSEIHNVLRNERRRQAIEYLRECDRTLTVDELAKYIATLETGESPPPHDVRKSVYVSLHQTHLPKLDELGIVEYDLRSKELELTDRATEVEMYMEILPGGTISWDMYYLGVSILAITTLVAVKLDIQLVAALGIEFWSWFYVLLFGCSSLFHLWDRRGTRLLP
jgi:hypothetical protein